MKNPRLWPILVIARSQAPFALTLVGSLGLWQLVVAVLRPPAYLLPGPLDVARALADGRYQWAQNLWVTLVEMTGGFALAAVGGCLLGILVVWSRWLEQTLLPVLVLINSIPKVAVAPLFLVWLGFGIVPNVVIVFFLTFFPIVMNTVTGLKTVDPELVDLARSLSAPQWQFFWKIRLPHALPYIFSGLKIAATVAVIGAIIGEFIASEKGLGALIIAAQLSLATPAIFGAIALVSLLGVLLFRVVNLVERVAMPWER